MSVDYEQLKLFVKEAMFTGGGINEPSAPENIPHRMPAADSDEKEQDRGDEKANKLYQLAVDAREATEVLIEALDEPIFDGAYEHAFKASACLRRAINSLEDSGAHPMPDQQVVAGPRKSQRYNAYGSGAAGNYTGGAGMGSFAMPAGEGGAMFEDNQLGAEASDEVEAAIPDEAADDRSERVAVAVNTTTPQTGPTVEKQLMTVLGAQAVEHRDIVDGFTGFLNKLGFQGAAGAAKKIADALQQLEE